MSVHRLARALALAAALLGPEGARAASSEKGSEAPARRPAQRSPADDAPRAAAKRSKAKARPNAHAERQKALNAFARALAILRAAGKLAPGKPGYLGETAQRERKLRELKQGCDGRAAAPGGERAYEPLAAAAEQIIDEYDQSLRAHR